MAFASSHSPSPQMACFVLSDILFKKVKQKKAANHHIGPFFFFTDKERFSYHQYY